MRYSRHKSDIGDGSVGDVRVKARLFEDRRDKSKFEVGGTEPVDREELITERMSGRRAGRQALTNVEGMGSRAQVGVVMPESDLLNS